MKAIAFVAIILVVFVLSGCKSETTSSSSGGAVDSTAFDYRLVGTWSDFDGTIRENGCVFGLQFGYDRSIRFLGVERSSGLIVPLGLNEGYRYQGYQPLSASDGILVVEHHFCIGPIDTVRVRYRIEGNDLIFPDSYCFPHYGFCIDWLPKTLHRTRTGTRVAMPHPFFCSVKIDDVQFLSRSVFDCPIYYPYPNIGVNSPTMITLFTSLQYPWGELWIPVENFKGIGTYTIRDDQARFSEFCEDYNNSNGIFDSSSRNIVTIDQFDIALNKCSGRFELDIFNPYGTPKWYWRLQGVFSLPIEGVSQSRQLSTSMMKLRQDLRNILSK
jgi:hypothetical protein